MTINLETVALLASLLAGLMVLIILLIGFFSWLANKFFWD